MSIEVIASPLTASRAFAPSNANRAPGNGIPVFWHRMKTCLFCDGIMMTSFLRRNSSSTTLHAAASRVVKNRGFLLQGPLTAEVEDPTRQTRLDVHGGGVSDFQPLKKRRFVSPLSYGVKAHPLREDHKHLVLHLEYLPEKSRRCVSVDSVRQ